MVVGNGDCRGRLNDIDETVDAVVKGIVVDPDVGRLKDADTISVAHSSLSIVLIVVSDYATIPWDGIVDVETMDDDVFGKLDGHLTTIGDVNLCAPSIDSFVTCDHKLLF